MADTYTQLYIHFVFAVKYRRSLIAPKWEENLHKYITGMIENKGHKMLAINGMPDHLHLFIGYQPAEPMTELIKVVKGESSKWIKEKNLPGLHSDGRTDMLPFHTAKCMSIGSANIFTTRRSITPVNLFGKSTFKCSTVMESIMMNGICSKPLNSLSLSHRLSRLNEWLWMLLKLP